MAEKANDVTGENPNGRSLRSVAVDYKKLAGYTSGHDRAVSADRRSTRSNKSGASKKFMKEVGKDKSVTDVDSCKGDFGLDESEEDRLQSEIECLAPTLAQRYSEQKIAEGTLQRLEDSQLPEDLEDNTVFDECKKEHLEQKKASYDRECRAKRRLELIKIREEITRSKDRAVQDEWAAEVMEKQRMLDQNRWLLKKKQQELDLKYEEKRQVEEFNRLEQEGRQMDDKGQTPNNREHDKHGRWPLQMAGVNECSGTQDYTGMRRSRRPHTVTNTMGSAADARVEDWLNKHSEWDNGEDLNDLERRAQQIMKQKQQSKPAWKSNKEKLKAWETPRQETDTTSEEDVPFVTKGVSHLKRLGLVPGGFGHRAEKEEDRSEDMAQLRAGTGRKTQFTCLNKELRNPLQVDTGFDYNVEQCDMAEPAPCGCAGAKPKVKTSKYAKSNINLVRQEVWPHTAVSKKYLKRTSLDPMDFESFVAGESKIIHAMLTQGDSNGIGRLRVLMMIAHWQGKVRNWAVIRSLYEGIIEEVEMGEREWSDNFSGYETMLPSMNVPYVQEATVQRNNKKTHEVYWCKPFQTNACELNPPHMSQIKPEEPAVPVLHICAYCWTNYKKRKEHMEIDCIAKK